MRVLVSEKLSPHRFKTPEGYLICTDAILARTGKQTYRRREVFGDMSDKGEEEIEINRDEKEVFDPVTLASFENKPLTIEHPNEDVNPENHHDYAVGFTRDIKRGRVDGNDVMLGTIVVTDAEAIKDIESGKLVELSCGYDCDVVDEANPQQRNIRGNHVALCERGRAGIARIVDSVKEEQPSIKALGKWEWDDVIQDWYDTGRHMYYNEIIRRSAGKDSVKDVNDLTKFKMALRNISKMYSNDPGIEYVTSVLRNLGYEVTVDSIDGWRENKNVPGEHIKKYRMNVTLEGKEHHFLVELYADVGEWKVKEINAYMLDSNNIKQGDSMKDEDFSKKTKQGFEVVEMYRDGGRLHAIVKRSSDYVVALGYDTSDGTWAQGRYVDTYGNALATLKEEKPSAKKIQDAVKDARDIKPWALHKGQTIVGEDENATVLSIKGNNRDGYDVEVKLSSGGKDTWYFMPNESVTVLDSKAKDAKTEYVFNWHDTYHGTKDKTRVDANNIKEAIRKFGDIIGLGGIGTANCYVISISPNDGYLSAYGRLSALLRTFKDCDTKDAKDRFYTIGTKLKNGNDVLTVVKTDDNYIYLKHPDGKVYAYNAYDLSQNLEMSPKWSYVDSMNDSLDDSLKKFAVKYTKDSKTYIQIVKANDLTDAVNKVKHCK